MIAGCGTMLPTRSIVVRKPSRKPPFARSSMLDAGSVAIAPSPATMVEAAKYFRRANDFRPAAVASIAGPRLRWQVNCATRAGRRAAASSGGGGSLDRDLDRLRHHRRRHRPLRLGPAAGHRRLRRLRHGALGDRRAHAQPGARRLRRPGDDLRHLALRGLRRAGEDRPHRLDRADAGARLRREPLPADRADDALLRRPLGAHQRQRRRGGAPAGRRGAGGAAEAAALAAPHAAGLRRARRLDAGADRHAGQRARLRGLARRRRRRASATSSSPTSASSSSSAPSPSRSCSARGSCRCARTARCRPTSAATPAPSSSSSASTTACTSSGCGRSRRSSASRGPSSTSATRPGVDASSRCRRRRAAAPPGSGRSRSAT